MLVTDHSSVGFEYLLLDRPLVRIEMPALLTRTNTGPGYVALIAESATTTRGIDDTVAAVEAAVADPGRGRAARRAVAEELFYEPGTATARALAEMYALMELAAPEALPAPPRLGGDEWVARAAEAGGAR